MISQPYLQLIYTALSEYEVALMSGRVAPSPNPCFMDAKGVHETLRILSKEIRNIKDKEVKDECGLKFRLRGKDESNRLD